MPSLRSRFKNFSTGLVFTLVAVFYVLSFGVVVGVAWNDQERILETLGNLQSRTVPEILRHQRLARNLEQLRRAGERVFSATTPETRQQSMFVVTLAASHPSVLEHREAAEQAREIEHFLAGVAHDARLDENTFAADYASWQRLSTRLGLLVDDISFQGVNLASDDLEQVSAVMRKARVKVIVAALAISLLVALWLLWLRAVFVLPLRSIGKALSHLSASQQAPRLAPSKVSEILAIRDAITRLHGLLAENEKARQALEALANRDGLTGLYNRRHFMVAAEAELHRAQRYRRPVIVGMADLDHFKRLNDTYGHAAGDTVLRTFAALLQENLRQSDLVCRYGGEEFAFLFPEITLADATVLAERCRAACAGDDISLADGCSVRVTFSMGLADASESTLEAALDRADEALYEAKRQGRNQVLVSGQLPLKLTQADRRHG
ncbi:MAG: diguanylate cyclase [Azonexus sp.]|jgi:diguanylate cyclase (GGDEF)-like protein|uniref:GGDEF domain-containing protein n=1 Tax=Azonexus sp. TaxID=1872668 RepID=UPI002818EE8C|nr:GGDEF domain-containing protein [Azonexus sp.]MDR0777244.1 diguanylate cyclase [Azonexus sp.]